MSHFITGRKAVAAAGTAEQLGDNVVPAGCHVVVKLLKDNTGYCYIGNTKANAEGANSYPLESETEPMAIPCDNTNEIWVDADTNGEGIAFYVASSINPA